MKLPKNIKAVAFVLDAEHVGHVGDLIRNCKNKQMVTMLSAWRGDIGNRPFCVVAGAPTLEDAGAVGGYAANWPNAELLITYVFKRLEEFAVTDYSSVWFVLVEKEREIAAKELLARLQPTAGSA